jgi:PD-(D/E)XK nuclease superfamily
VTLSIEQISDLLSGLKKLPKAVNREQTFMEIAGYPHFENVCSNILAFYLQPSNNHGFGTLFLDVLATLTDEKIDIDWYGVEVRREETTENRKRLDLVIKSDKYVIGIENKIYAGLSNPFEEYSNHLKFSCNNRQVFKVLLSLRYMQPQEKLKGFKPICYEIFFQKILENINSYTPDTNEPHLTFLRDFIQTMKKRQETTVMDYQRLEYFRDNQQNITALIAEVEGFRKDMWMKTQKLKEIVAVKDISTFFKISPGVWKSPKDFTNVNWYIVEINDYFWLELNIFLTPAGWTIVFSNNNKKGTIDRSRQWLKDRDIEVETSIENTDWLIYTGKDNIHPYEAKIEDLSIWTIDMLKRITTVTYTVDQSTDLNTNFVTSNSAVDATAPLN